METPFHEGKILLMNKPLGWTSFDLVHKVRIAIEKHYGLKRMGIKVGHAGTLDPLATGLMLICTGKMTREISALQGLVKEYTGTFYFGVSSASFDRETPPDREFPTEHIHDAMLHARARDFIGIQEQMPPLYSAKQVDGKRAYEFARKGKELELKKNPIEICEFELSRIQLPNVDFRVVCSKGTYIRSLARDFGEAVGSGAMLSELQRTPIGSYRLEDASYESEGIQLLTRLSDEHTGRIQRHEINSISKNEAKPA